MGIWEAAGRGAWDEAARLQRLSLALSEAVYSHGYLPGLKAAMSARGLCGDVMAEPGVPLPEGSARRIAEAVRGTEFDV